MNTFLIPEVPGPCCGPEELADFWELQCLASLRRSASIAEIRNAWDKRQEEDATEDMEEDIRAEGAYDAAWQEVDSRERLLRDAYPFTFLAQGATTLRVRQKVLPLYIFLLLATRLPHTKRTFAGMAASTLFEHIAAAVMRCYLGDGAHAVSAGATPDDSHFKNRLNSICDELKETAVRPDWPDKTSTSGDRGLDAVAWIPFQDGRPGQLMLWGQAKTGVGWRDALLSLQPESFIKNWLHPAPRVTPVRAFLVTERAEAHRWDDFQNTAGLFFDRCRIMEFEGRLPAD